MLWLMDFWWFLHIWFLVIIAKIGDRFRGVGACTGVVRALGQPPSLPRPTQK